MIPGFSANPKAHWGGPLAQSGHGGQPAIHRLHPPATTRCVATLTCLTQERAQSQRGGVWAWLVSFTVTAYGGGPPCYPYNADWGT